MLVRTALIGEEREPNDHVRRKAGIYVSVKVHHVVYRGLGEVKHLVGDAGHAVLDGDVFIYGLAVGQHVAAVRAQHAGYVAYGRGFPGAVGAYKAVDRPRRHRHRKARERGMGAEALHNAPEFNFHRRRPPFRLFSP